MRGLPLLGAEDHRMDVAAWLQDLGLERYVPAFRENEIDERVLPSLTAEDLKDLGVTLVGHRRRLLDAIAALGVAAPAATVTTAPRDAPAPAEAERRQLTVMFCDLVGSTALSTRFDPEDLRELMGDYHRAVSETIGHFDGFVAKYMGDGVLVYFGYPQAHEDDAERAVRAGLAVIEAVGRLPAREDLLVRLGIATGLAVVGDLIGEGAAQERGRSAGATTICRNWAATRRSKPASPRRGWRGSKALSSATNFPAIPQCCGRCSNGTGYR
jgi:class 3 adenylate cyclase